MSYAIKYNTLKKFVTTHITENVTLNFDTEGTLILIFKSVFTKDVIKDKLEGIDNEGIPPGTRYINAIILHKIDVDWQFDVVDFDKFSYKKLANDIKVLSRIIVWYTSDTICDDLLYQIVCRLLSVIPSELLYIYYENLLIINKGIPKKITEIPICDRIVQCGSDFGYGVIPIGYNWFTEILLIIHSELLKILRRKNPEEIIGDIRLFTIFIERLITIKYNLNPPAEILYNFMKSTAPILQDYIIDTNFYTFTPVIFKQSYEEVIAPVIKSAGLYRNLTSYIDSSGNKLDIPDGYKIKGLTQEIKKTMSNVLGESKEPEIERESKDPEIELGSNVFPYQYYIIIFSTQLMAWHDKIIPEEYKFTKYTDKKNTFLSSLIVKFIVRLFGLSYTYEID